MKLSISEYKTMDSMLIRINDSSLGEIMTTKSRGWTNQDSQVLDLIIGVNPKLVLKVDNGMTAEITALGKSFITNGGFTKQYNLEKQNAKKNFEKESLELENLNLSIKNLTTKVATLNNDQSEMIASNILKNKRYMWFTALNVLISLVAIGISLKSLLA